MRHRPRDGMPRGMKFRHDTRRSRFGDGKLVFVIWTVWGQFPVFAQQVQFGFAVADAARNKFVGDGICDDKQSLSQLLRQCGISGWWLNILVSAKFRICAFVSAKRTSPTCKIVVGADEALRAIIQVSCGVGISENNATLPGARMQNALLEGRWSF